MKKYFLFFLIPAMPACKFQLHSDSQYAGRDEDRVYKLKLDPPAGEKYHFDMVSQSDLTMEVNDKKINNKNKTTSGVFYTFNKDSIGDLILDIQYDKIHIYSKQGDTESDVDAMDANNNGDPLEILLGKLKNAKIQATISRIGEVKSLSGLEEMENQFVAQSNPTNAADRNAARQKWDKLIGGELVNKNMGQLFHIFPDSAMHVGDKWQLQSKEKGEMGLNTKNYYTLQSIRGEVATIESEGAITSDSTTNLMGFDVTTDLKGEQKGEYQVQTRTGMLLNAKISATIEGTLQLMGRSVPVTIKNSVTMNRR